MYMYRPTYSNKIMHACGLGVRLVHVCTWSLRIFHPLLSSILQYIHVHVHLHDLEWRLITVTCTVCCKKYCEIIMSFHERFVKLASKLKS